MTRAFSRVENFNFNDRRRGRAQAHPTALATQHVLLVQSTEYNLDSPLSAQQTSLLWRTN